MTSTIIHIIQYYCTTTNNALHTVYCSKNSIILTKHDYSHDRVGTCSSSTDPSRRPREPSKASSWSLRYVQSPRRVRKPPRSVRGGALEAPRSLFEYTLRGGFAKAPRAPPFGNDSSDIDKPPYLESIHWGWNIKWKILQYNSWYFRRTYSRSVSFR